MYHMWSVCLCIFTDISFFLTTGYWEHKERDRGHFRATYWPCVWPWQVMMLHDLFYRHVQNFCHFLQKCYVMSTRGQNINNCNSNIEKNTEEIKVYYLILASKSLVTREIAVFRKFSDLSTEKEESETRTETPHRWGNVRRRMVRLA